MSRGLAGGCLAVVAALIVAGCGATGLPKGGDATRGKQLFAQGCAQCHTLADAGSKGVLGPNLDDAFAQSRKDGLGETTIEAVVRGQIAYPIEQPTTGTPGMPADIYTGEDADAVAAYVASVAGLPVRARPGAATGGTTTAGGTGTGGAEAADGEAVFAQAGCGGCHTLAAAGSNGAVGPNLDDSKPPRALVVERVTNGRGAMPPFKDSLSPQQIQAVADYVVASTK